MLRKMLLHLPLAVALGLTATAVPAVAHVPGEVQLMTAAPGTWIDHTIRHAAGNWDRFGQLGTGGWEPPANLAATIVNGELNLVYTGRYPVKPFSQHTALRVRHADGTWSDQGAGVGFGYGPHAVAAVNGELHVVRRESGGTGGLRHSARRADGSWSSAVDVPVPAGSTGLAAAASAAGLEVLVIKDQSLMSTTLTADGTWSPATPATFFATRFTASTVDVAVVGSELHAVINSTDGALYHAIRRSDGRWSGWGYVAGETGSPGRIDSAAVTVSRNTLQLAVTTTEGGVFHAIRFENGTWQRYGDVRGEAGGSASHDVAIAGD